ncbi:MAG: TMEM165/GDT1 family protein, partial [Halobacteriaceae archaeon]
MTEATFIEVLVVAFVAQLTVLPGEKAQFAIAGLATRYRPLVVVMGAATAFGIWTAIEIALGRTLQGLLPSIYLDGATAGLFLLFAILLFRSAPDNPGESTIAASDGGVSESSSTQGVNLFNYEIPAVGGGFLPAFAMIAFGEFGDKTQLVTFSLAVQFTHGAAIWAGEMLAIIPASLLTATFSNRFAHRLNIRWVHYGASALFLFFGFDILLGIT